ncbi:PDZ domain-containing protein [bacterium]|nr:MAG: PDZ domain-containing protein [bacterium]
MKFLWAFCISFLLMSTQSQAQQMRTFRMNADSAHIIIELGARLQLQANNNIVVEELMPIPNKQDSDLKTGDVIFGINGKRIKTMPELREHIDKTEPEKEIKLGVQRGEQKFIVRYIKAKETPGRRMVMMDGPGDGRQMISAFLTLGFIGEMDNGKLKVSQILPIAEEGIQTYVKTGAFVTKVNGKSFKSLQELELIVDGIKSGDSFEILVENDGDEIALKLTKREMNNRVIRQ